MGSLRSMVNSTRASTSRRGLIYRLPRDTIPWIRSTTSNCMPTKMYACVLMHFPRSCVTWVMYISYKSVIGDFSILKFLKMLDLLLQFLLQNNFVLFKNKFLNLRLKGRLSENYIIISNSRVFPCVNETNIIDKYCSRR